ncbi:hypothetical protein IWZ03DRAFT_120028 [Phyllosticta citriasiana]|uniref:Zn(2)-C6 fungal-type domain-containing protein n=1 Tax=Phyllosticta citriasiana TaxID=595635 RepID=A0ABR1KYE1_9PEZI
MSAFRPIRPSSSSPLSQQPATGHDSSYSDRNTQRDGSTDDQETGSVHRARKRRAPAHVSRNACTNCKSARAKCDGQDPDPCGRCIARDMKDQCRYEMHVKQVKEDMVRKIKSLEQQNAKLQGSIKERENQVEAIFDALRTSDRGPEALIRLRAGQSCEEIAAWLGAFSLRDVGRASLGSETKMSDIVENYESSMRLNSPCQPSHSGSILQWTSVTSDPGLLQHLTSLFFYWVHPVHMLFNEERFRESCCKGDTTYCSSALVNIICAMGCFYLVDPDGRECQSKQLLKRFLAQALEDVGKESPQNLTYAVTYCILFLVEVGMNEARKASSHLRLAVESLKSLARWEYSSEAVDILVCGAHTLSATWSTLTFQRSPFAGSQTSAWRNEHTEIKTDARWTPYRFPQDALGHVTSHTSIVSKQLSKLSGVINDIGAVYFAQEGRVEARSIVAIYQRLREWKNNMPAALSMKSDSTRESPQLPHVLFVNILYNVCLCQLLQPILELDELPMATRDHIKSIAEQSSVEGIKLLERYRHLYTLRYSSPLLAFCVVHICVAFLQGRKSAPEDAYPTIRFGLEAMEEALAGFEYAGPLELLFCKTVAELDLAATEALKALISSLPEYGPEELLDACERVTCTQPRSTLVGRIDKSFGDEFVRLWKPTVGGMDGKNRRQQGSTTSTASASSARLMQIKSVVNP